MSQFHAHKNLDSLTADFAQFVLDIQSPLLQKLGTVMVVPLIKKSKYAGMQIKHLNPVLLIDGESYLMMTQSMFSMPRNDIGHSVNDFSSQSHEIVAAIDCLLSGI